MGITKTLLSILGALRDWLVLQVPAMSFFYKKSDNDFAFLVHPRTDNVLMEDTYGENDILRPYPAFRLLFHLCSEQRARDLIGWYSKCVGPITLSQITVRNQKITLRGRLYSVVRTPSQLFERRKSSETRSLIQAMCELAYRKGAAHVGLGALLPSISGYGKRLIADIPIERRASISTGHAYTAYVIVEYVRLFVEKRNQRQQRVALAVMGAAGSTGIATLRMLMRTWDGPLMLLLVDLPGKRANLEKLKAELIEYLPHTQVIITHDPHQVRACEYVIVVTNAPGSVITPEHVRPGTVIIDDTQPRNTTEALTTHGSHVIDVLARVPGLDVGFGFGFKTSDKEITFTCLAETVLRAAVGEKVDLAVGEVTHETMEKTLSMIARARAYDLVPDRADFPLVSFGKMLSDEEKEVLLASPQEKQTPAVV